MGCACCGSKYRGRSRAASERRAARKAEKSILEPAKVPIKRVGRDRPRFKNGRYRVKPEPVEVAAPENVEE